MTDMNWAGSSAQGLVEILVVHFLTMALRSWMVGFEFSVIRLEVFEGPSVVAELFPVIQILLGCHTGRKSQKSYQKILASECELRHT